MLLQIPAGALPVNKGFFTRSEHRVIAPYSTCIVEYFFYFPFAGTFEHYPVGVTKDGGRKCLAQGKPQLFNVSILFERGAATRHGPFSFLLPRFCLTRVTLPLPSKVVTRPSSLDIKSWPSVAAEASLEQVLAFLRSESPALFKHQLHRIFWRLKDAAAFDGTVAVLHHRGIFQRRVWYEKASCARLHPLPPLPSFARDTT